MPHKKKKETGYTINPKGKKKSKAMRNQKAIFLDRDGVLNKDTGYVFKTEELIILPQVIEALKKLQSANYLLIVVTNQSGVARGYYKEVDVIHIHNYMNNIFEEAGITISSWYYCPHHPEAQIEKYKINCQCRKPEPGMLLKATEKWNIDTDGSYMIGDKESDILAGKAMDIKTVQVKGSYPLTPAAHLQVESLHEAANLILQSNHLC